MDTHTQAVSWYDAIMTYSLLSSDYPTIVRYISAAFIALGFIFFIPIIILVAVDFGIYIYRICWSRPWNQNRNQPAHLRELGHHHEEQLHKLPLDVVDGSSTVTSTVTSTVAAAARKRIQRLSESDGGSDASSA